MGEIMQTKEIKYSVFPKNTPGSYCQQEMDWLVVGNEQWLDIMEGNEQWLDIIEEIFVMVGVTHLLRLLMFLSGKGRNGPTTEESNDTTDDNIDE